MNPVAAAMNVTTAIAPVATAPRQVYTWDIPPSTTGREAPQKLAGPAKRVYYDAYVMIDIYYAMSSRICSSVSVVALRPDSANPAARKSGRPGSAAPMASARSCAMKTSLRSG